MKSKSDGRLKVVRKVGVRKDNRAIIYFPLSFVESEYVIVEKDEETGIITIRPLYL
jgi:hypothetical protein